MGSRWLSGHGRSTLSHPSRSARSFHGGPRAADCPAGGKYETGVCQSRIEVGGPGPVACPHAGGGAGERVSATRIWQARDFRIITVLLVTRHIRVGRIWSDWQPVVVVAGRRVWVEYAEPHPTGGRAWAALNGQVIFHGHPSFTLLSRRSVADRDSWSTPMPVHGSSDEDGHRGPSAAPVAVDGIGHYRRAAVEMQRRLTNCQSLFNKPVSICGPSGNI